MLTALASGLGVSGCFSIGRSIDCRTHEPSEDLTPSGVQVSETVYEPIILGVITVRVSQDADGLLRY